MAKVQSPNPLTDKTIISGLVAVAVSTTLECLGLAVNFGQEHQYIRVYLFSGAGVAFVWVLFSGFLWLKNYPERDKIIIPFFIGVSFCAPVIVLLAFISLSKNPLGIAGAGASASVTVLSTPVTIYTAEKYTLKDAIQKLNGFIGDGVKFLDYCEDKEGNFDQTEFEYKHDSFFKETRDFLTRYPIIWENKRYVHWLGWGNSSGEGYDGGNPAPDVVKRKSTSTMDINVGGKYNSIVSHINKSRVP